jgi:hypothetical protein
MGFQVIETLLDPQERERGGGGKYRNYRVAAIQVFLTQGPL